MKKYFITILLFIFYQNSFSQEFQLGINVFYNDISKIYMSKGQPFTGKIILYREKNLSKSENGVSVSFYVRPTSIFYNINKKVIEIKNGKVEGLITTISTKGDTISKFYLKNNKISGKFFFKYEDQNDLIQVKGSSFNDTLNGKIQVFNFSSRTNKFEITNDGNFSKTGGKPIGEFRSYYSGKYSRFPKGLNRSVVPFSDYIGMIKIDSNDLNNYIKDIDYNILTLNSLFGVIDPGGVKLMSENRTDIVNDNKFFGYIKKVEGKNTFGNYFETRLSYMFNGDYEKSGISIENITSSDYQKINELLDKNHEEWCLFSDGMEKMYRINVLDGKLDGLYIDVYGNDFGSQRLKTYFDNGTEVGPRTFNGPPKYEIESIVNDRFNGKLRIYSKISGILPKIECYFKDGEIGLPVTVYHDNFNKKITIVEKNGNYEFSEYFSDGSLKINETIDQKKLQSRINNIMNDYYDIIEHQKFYR